MGHNGRFWTPQVKCTKCKNDIYRIRELNKIITKYSHTQGTTITTVDYENLEETLYKGRLKSYVSHSKIEEVKGICLRLQVNLFTTHLKLTKEKKRVHRTLLDISELIITNKLIGLYKDKVLFSNPKDEDFVELCKLFAIKSLRDTITLSKRLSNREHEIYSLDPDIKLTAKEKKNKNIRRNVTILKRASRIACIVATHLATITDTDDVTGLRLLAIFLSNRYIPLPDVVDFKKIDEEEKLRKEITNYYKFFKAIPFMPVVRKKEGYYELTEDEMKKNYQDFTVSGLKVQKYWNSLDLDGKNLRKKRKCKKLDTGYVDKFNLIQHIQKIINKKQ